MVIYGQTVDKKKIIIWGKKKKWRVKQIKKHTVLLLKIRVCVLLQYYVQCCFAKNTENQSMAKDQADIVRNFDLGMFDGL